MPTTATLRRCPNSWRSRLWGRPFLPFLPSPSFLSPPSLLPRAPAAAARGAQGRCCWGGKRALGGCCCCQGGSPLPAPISVNSERIKPHSPPPSPPKTPQTLYRSATSTGWFWTSRFPLARWGPPAAASRSTLGSPCTRCALSLSLGADRKTRAETRRGPARMQMGCYRVPRNDFDKKRGRWIC